MDDDDIEVYADSVNPWRIRLALAGQTLDHAEFVERVPELQRENSVTELRQYGRLAPSWDTPRGMYEAFILPSHPAVNAYRSELMFSDPGRTIPKISLLDARTHLAECADDYQHRCDFRRATYIAGWNDGGKYVSLRAILDAEHNTITAYNDMTTIREHELRFGKRASVVNGYFKTGRTIMIDGVRVPIIKKVQP